MVYTEHQPWLQREMDGTISYTRCKTCARVNLTTLQFDWSCLHSGHPYNAGIAVWPNSSSLLWRVWYPRLDLGWNNWSGREYWTQQSCRSKHAFVYVCNLRLGECGQSIKIARRCHVNFSHAFMHAYIELDWTTLSKILATGLKDYWKVWIRG